MSEGTTVQPALTPEEWAREGFMRGETQVDGLLSV